MRIRVTAKLSSSTRSSVPSIFGSCLQSSVAVIRGARTIQNPESRSGKPLMVLRQKSAVASPRAVDLRRNHCHNGEMAAIGYSATGYFEIMGFRGGALGAAGEIANVSQRF